MTDVATVNSPISVDGENADADIFGFAVEEALGTTDTHLVVT